MSKEFKFGPEHVGKKVRHADGDTSITGIIIGIDLYADKYTQMSIRWNDVFGNRGVSTYSIDGVYSPLQGVAVFLDEPAQTYTVVDQLNDIHYTPGGGANFRLTVTDGTTENTAAVDLFEFLMWAQADGLIDGYSAETVGEEVVILPVPDEQQNHRATAQVKRLYVWLQQLPLATFTRALNERPAMWSSFDENMEPINA